MVLGGKTLLWCENGIVFLRPPQAFAGVSLTPEGAGSLFRLRSRAPSVLSERDHLFTGRCDLVILPLSRNLPLSCSTTRGNGSLRKVNEEGSSPSRSCHARAR